MPAPSVTPRGFQILPEEGEQPDPDSFYGFVFQDSDFYKWIEAVAYSLAQHPDEKLEQDLDLHFFIDYSTGGFLQLLCRWLQQGMEGDPEKYARAVGASIKKYIDPVPKEWV